MSEISSEEVTAVSQGSKFIADVNKKLAFRKSRDVKIKHTDAINAVFQIIEKNFPKFVINLHNPVTLQHTTAQLISNASENKQVNAVLEVVSKPLLLNETTINSTFMKILIRIHVTNNYYKAPLIPTIKISKDYYKNHATKQIAIKISAAIQNTYKQLCDLKNKTITSHELLTYHMLLSLLENIECLVTDCFGKVTAYDKVKDIINDIRSHEEPSLILQNSIYAQLLSKCMTFIQQRQKLLSNQGSANFLSDAVSERFPDNINTQLDIIDNTLRYILFDMAEEIAEDTFASDKYQHLNNVATSKDANTKKLFKSFAKTDSKNIQQHNLQFLQVVTNKNNSAQYYLEQCANTEDNTLCNKHYANLKQILSESYYLKLLNKVGVFSKKKLSTLEIKTKTGTKKLADKLMSYMAKLLSLRAKLHVVQVNMQSISGLIRYWGNQSKQQLKTEYANVFSKYQEISTQLAEVANNLEQFINKNDAPLRSLVKSKTLSGFYITAIYKLPLKKLQTINNTVISHVEAAKRSMQQQAIDKDITASKENLHMFLLCHNVLTGKQTKKLYRNFVVMNAHIMESETTTKTVDIVTNNNDFTIEEKSKLQCNTESGYTRLTGKQVKIKGGGKMAGVEGKKLSVDELKEQRIAAISLIGAAVTTFVENHYFSFWQFWKFFFKSNRHARTCAMWLRDTQNSHGNKHTYVKKVGETVHSIHNFTNRLHKQKNLNNNIVERITEDLGEIKKCMKAFDLLSEQKSEKQEQKGEQDKPYDHKKTLRKDSFSPVFPQNKSHEMANKNELAIKVIPSNFNNSNNHTNVQITQNNNNTKIPSISEEKGKQIEERLMTTFNAKLHNYVSTLSQNNNISQNNISESPEQT
ncbi:MAG: hypothetical protein COB50_03790 [Thiotrichales bacterium]|nr:MAG: hypothetical protein COB50_03790 [Thiotrichales bacterium]